MNGYENLSKIELENLKIQLTEKYNKLKSKGFALDMSRGKPGTDQLDISNEMLDIKYLGDYKTTNGFDVRNYGILDGIGEAKELLMPMLGAEKNEIIIGGNSSLQLMYDSVVRSILFGTGLGRKPWKDYKTIKFLCPVPGYDRHFAICESLGIEMINVPMTGDGPDMDLVERMVADDENIKGMWCVPTYSNPDGISYSDFTVKRLAKMKTAADDFRIFWDNAYSVHHLSDTPDRVLSILDECKKLGNADRVYVFISTSKISFPGSGVAAMASGLDNINFIKSHMTFQTIGYDKINQLRQVKYFKNFDGIKKHMEKHRKILEPKFNTVLGILEREITPYKIGDWIKPNGGYFISFNGINGTAKRTVQLCKEAGVIMTSAGATFPYGKDPNDSNIRIAPTFPPVEELKIAMEIFCVSVKIAAVEKLINS